MGDELVWSVEASVVAARTSNPIRQVIDRLNIAPPEGKDLIPLSLGDPTKFPNLKPCPVVGEAVIEAVKSGSANGYIHSTGDPKAKEAVAKLHATPEAPVTGDDIVLASGCSGSLQLAIGVLAGEGDNILIPKPGFALYRTLAASMGVELKEYDLLASKGWEANTEQMAALIDSKTKAVVINNPSNPCGSVFSKEHLLDILDVCRKARVPIISDEIYANMAFPPAQYHDIASLSKDVPILACSGLAKRYLVPGWRLGWVVIHDRRDIFQDGNIRDGLLRLSTLILGPCSVIQAAVPAILGDTPQSFYEDTLATLAHNASVAFNGLKAIDGLAPIQPAGAMYAMCGIDMDKFPSFQNDVEFAQALIEEEGVFVLPGECFSMPNFFRVVFCAPPEKLKEAFDRIAVFCDKHRK